MPMPRQPEVFVHELEPEQAQRLVRIARTSKDLWGCQKSVWVADQQ
jgi:hypothetical protein